MFRKLMDLPRLEWDRNDGTRGRVRGGRVRLDRDPDFFVPEFEPTNFQSHFRRDSLRGNVHKSHERMYSVLNSCYTSAIQIDGNENVCACWWGLPHGTGKHLSIAKSSRRKATLVGCNRAKTSGLGGNRPNDTQQTLRSVPSVYIRHVPERSAKSRHSNPGPALKQTAANRSGAFTFRMNSAAFVFFTSVVPEIIYCFGITFFSSFSLSDCQDSVSAPGQRKRKFLLVLPCLDAYFIV